MLEALETEYFVGRTLGRYRIEAFVGRGSTGTVYRASAQDANPAAVVAVKIVAPELLAAPGGSSF
jgi:hypothetical protein